MKMICRCLVGVALSLSLASCVTRRAIDFRVIDADTRRPLDGVELTRISRNADLVLQGKNEVVPAGRTDADGMAKRVGFASNQTHSVVFRKAGYADASVGVTRRPAVVVVSPFPPANAEGPVDVLPKDGLIVLELHPVKGQAATAPSGRRDGGQ